MAGVASFGNAHDRKKSFKINEMPFMAQIVKRKWRDVDSSKQEKKKRVKKNVTEM